MGRAQTLAHYAAFHFDEADHYFARGPDGDLYDSKLILAMAEEVRTGQVPENNYSGGAPTAGRLRSLGFTVTTRPHWGEAELILLCGSMASQGWRRLKPEEPETAELSFLLRSLSQHPEELRGLYFYCPEHVAAKSRELMAHLHGHGQPHQTMERDLVLAFRYDYDGRLARRAADLRAELSPPNETTPIPDVDEDTAADEGRALERTQLRYERDPRLRRRKIEEVLKAGGAIACEVCGFRFERSYGDRGRDYIEVHHRTPLHVSGRTKTGLTDLAMLCSNCHRMIHRRAPWLTVEELQELFSTQRAARGRP